MKSMQPRYFTPEGIAEFERQLGLMETRGDRIDLQDLVENPKLTMVIPTKTRFEPKDFKDKLGYGKYLFEILAACEEDLRTAGLHPVGHRGLWSWFAAAWFPLISMNSKGIFFVGAPERYILSSMKIRDYRHLLYGPWIVFSAAHQTPDLIAPFMSDRVNEFSNFFEQIASRREILNNRSALELIYTCYVDNQKQAAIPRALGKQTPGGLERFGTVYSQLAVNFDLYSMSAEEIAALLPQEFRDWLGPLSHSSLT